jgi:hypothetical protein
MNKQLVVLSVLACCLTASSGFAQNVQWTCKAVRANGTQSWVWTSESRDYAWNQVNQMCSASGAIRCNIGCSMATSDTTSVGGSYSCAVHGYYGHLFYGTGPTMSAAHQNALDICRTKGITPCTVDVCVLN